MLLEDLDALNFHAHQILEICNKIKAKGLNLDEAAQEQNIARINPRDNTIPPLSKLEARILDFLRENIKKNPNKRCYFQKKEIGRALGIQFETMRTCITRLKNKGYIKLVDYLNGPNVGCSSFDITPIGWAAQIKKQTEEQGDLVGLQERCLEFIQSRASESLITDKLKVEDFANALSCPIGSVKTTIRRLVEKGFVRQAAYKNGRCGWVKLEVL